MQRLLGLWWRPSLRPHLSQGKFQAVFLRIVQQPQCLSTPLLKLTELWPTGMQATMSTKSRRNLQILKQRSWKNVSLPVRECQKVESFFPDFYLLSTHLILVCRICVDYFLALLLSDPFRFLILFKAFFTQKLNQFLHFIPPNPSQPNGLYPQLTSSASCSVSNYLKLEFKAQYLFLKEFLSTN